MNNILQEKSRLRAALLRLRRQAGRDTSADAAIMQALTATVVWHEADSIFVYLPLAWEIDTQPIIRLAFAQNKRVAVPVSGPDGGMKAVCIGPDTPLQQGRYGILEPELCGEILLPQDTSLSIVPALAFDRSGMRLGRGGGYYDRWLAGIQNVSVGLCYTQYLMDSLPCQEHDRSVDAICTQEGMLWIKE